MLDLMGIAYYFLTFLKSKKTQQYIEMCLAGSTQKYISLGELRKMPIPDPAVETLESYLMHHTVYPDILLLKTFSITLLKY